MPRARCPSRERVLFSALMNARDAEADAFARHVVGAPAPPELAARYRAACARLFPDPPDPVDAVLLAFAARRPWAVGPLDAATALLRPASRLRARLLVMAAVLETSPRFADAFLPQPAGRTGALARLVAIGAAALARLAVGLPLYGALRARA